MLDAVVRRLLRVGNVPPRDRAGQGPVRGDVRAVWIGNVRPELAAGRYPVKRLVGDVLEVSADVLREGHGELAAILRYRTVRDTAWRETPMAPVGNDRWAA